MSAMTCWLALAFLGMLRSGDW
ncbi:hypothetical protein XFF6990_430113 [Xanthomonas citri pv. fuscans]|nr:hypothetical protein XFF6990_430113 [Xanthomonas citri pv. fuscans]